MATIDTLTPEQVAKNLATAGMGTIQGTTFTGTGGSIDYTKPLDVSALNTTTINNTSPQTDPYKGLGSSTVLPPPPSYTPPPTPTAEDTYAKDLAGLPQAPSQEQIQAELDKKYQIEEKTKIANALKAQIDTNTAEAEVAQRQLESMAGGKDVTSTFLGRQQQEISRQLAIKNLPLTAQYQASLGDLQGAMNTVDKLFTAKLADAEAQYNRAKDLIDSAYAVASAKEKKQLEAKQREEDIKLQNEKDLTTYKQSIAKELIANGQADLITELTSAKTQDEVNNVASKIQAVTTTPQSIISSLPTEQQSDPFIQLLASTSGGKPLTDTSIQKLDKGLTVLSQLGLLQNNVKDMNTGPIVGLFRGKNPWDTNAQTIKAQLNAIVPNLARGVYGEVGVLTDNDIKTYAQTLPNLTSTEDVRNAVLGITVDLIGKSIKRTLEVNAANKKDVSGFIDLYKEMETTRDSIFSQLSGYGKNSEKSLENAGVTESDKNTFYSVIGGGSTQTPGYSFWGSLSNFFQGK